MNNTKVKICGVKETSTIDCCINNNVDYFGLIFHVKSPRNINLEVALKLINYVKSKKITPVGVFVSQPINELKDIIKKTHLNHIQLHGNEDSDYINLIKKDFELKIIKSVGIKEKNDFIKINKPWFISGGININNIKKIRKNLIPYGIDISSGVEEKLGIKSSQKITKLLEIFNA